jgi:hypothetical protein
VVCGTPRAVLGSVTLTLVRSQCYRLTSYHGAGWKGRSDVAGAL